MKKIQRKEKKSAKLRKNWRVLRELFYLRFHGLAVFRLDFFAPFFVDGSLFLIQLLAFGVVYSNVDTIGSWGKGEMILYIGTFSLLNAVNMTVYFFGINTIPGKIRSGELDLYLTKPVSPLFRLTFENISPGSVPLILMSVCIAAYGVSRLETRPTFAKLTAYLFWIVLMEILYYEMEVIIRSVSLYIVSMARMEQIEEAGIDLCMKLPGIAFYGVYKVIFYLALPYGIMATLPVQSMIGEMTLRTAVYGVCVVVLFSAVTCAVWKRGLRHYNSASS
ncbi:MAG: ABC transporter permease [Lachnospiraceae bacterium]|nr:ABC transporter permease [Lachnospiraceae bacterium]